MAEEEVTRNTDKMVVIEDIKGLECLTGKTKRNNSIAKNLIPPKNKETIMNTKRNLENKTITKKNTERLMINRKNTKNLKNKKNLENLMKTNKKYLENQKKTKNSVLWVCSEEN